ncbi:MAG: hypothetical protein E7E21_12465 [Peptostreptococcaceae bacterium]|nr:hypothetical protein [Peptostreptococcaceae bacterium]
MSKKTLTIGVVVAILILFGGYIFMKPLTNDSKQNNNNNNKIEKNEETSSNKTIDFLSAVQGLKIESVELVDDPVGFEGAFLAPEQSIRNGLDYFLNESKNEKISRVNIDVDGGCIKVNVDYKITNKITTPIEVKVIPSLNEDKDLVLKIDEVKFLDLKIANWIVDLGVKNFVKDFFSGNNNLAMEFNDGNVLIDKSNFKGVVLNNISIDSKMLKLDMRIDLDKLI